MNGWPTRRNPFPERMAARRRAVTAGIGVLAGAAGIALGYAALYTLVIKPSVESDRPTTSRWAAPWFEERRDEFAEVVRLARGGHIDGLLTDYHGGDLPPQLAYLSVTGRVSVVGTCEDEPVLFLPQMTFLVDGALGYVHMTCERYPVESVRALDLFGDPGYPTLELGDGWWWTGGRPADPG